MNKANCGILIKRKLRSLLSRSLLLTLSKSLVIPHFEYGDVIYDQPDNIITSPSKGSARKNLYQELG